jgi:sRNA-binding regulator protein Hfq
MIQGEITAFSTYEIIVKTKTGKEVLIPKGAITCVDLPDGWRQLPDDLEKEP